MVYDSVVLGSTLVVEDVTGLEDPAVGEGLAVPGEVTWSIVSPAKHQAGVGAAPAASILEFTPERPFAFSTKVRLTLLGHSPVALTVDESGDLVAPADSRLSTSSKPRRLKDLKMVPSIRMSRSSSPRESIVRRSPWEKP